MQNILSKKDIENIEILIKITKTIDNLYQKLYSLELESLKDSLEYQKLLNNLSIAIETENNKYEELNLTYERCNAILEYLEKEKLPLEMDNDITSIVNEDYDNRIFRRIKHFIIRKIMLSYSEELLKPTLKDISKIISKISTEPSVITQTEWQTNLQEAFEIDIYSFYLYFLEKMLKEITDDNLKERLLASKYYVSMIDKDIEKNLISSSFDIKCPFYFYTEYCKDLYNIPNFYFTLYKKGLSQKYISASINGLISFPDSSFKIFKVKVMEIIMTCLLRSSFVISDDDTLEEINYSFNENIEDEEFFKDNKSHIGVDVVKKAFLNIKNDKEKIKDEMLIDNNNSYDNNC